MKQNTLSEKPVSTPGGPTDANTHPGGILFACAFVAFAVFLLFHLGGETKFSAGKSLFAQPRFWPAVGAGGMALFGLAHLIAIWRTRIPIAPRLTAIEVLTWLRALEFLIWFMVYVMAVPIIGYLPATLLLTTLLSARLGYRTKAALLIAAAMGAGIVLVFKTFLAVKIPGGAVYEYLPAALRNFLITYF